MKRRRMRRKTRRKRKMKSSRQTPPSCRLRRKGERREGKSSRIWDSQQVKSRGD